MQLQASIQQLYLKRDLTKMFSCNFYEVFKYTFFIEALEATASASLSQAVYPDIIIKTSKKHQLWQYF